MIPKPLYELIPYLYLLVGGGIIAGLKGYATPVGLLLFAFGTWLWLIRSDYRRINLRQPKYAGARFYWGESIYELQPFFYILMGLLIVGLLEHPVRLLSGPVLMMVGVAVMLLRSSKRKQAAPVIRLKPRDAAAVVSKENFGSAYVKLVFSEQSSPAEVVEFHPPLNNCNSCQIIDICGSVKLKPRSVQEIMRLSQTLSPEAGFGFYLEAVGRIEQRKVSDAELRSVLSLLYRYSDLCVTWRQNGRLAVS
ncbi:MAG: hypothetical protein V7629_07560 [Motiliproteus sp.]